MSTISLSFTMFYSKLLVELFPASDEGIKIAALTDARKWTRSRSYYPGVDNGPNGPINTIHRTLKVEINRLIRESSMLFEIITRGIKIMSFTELMIADVCVITKKHIDGFEVMSIDLEQLSKINKTLKEHFNLELEMEVLK